MPEPGAGRGCVAYVLKGYPRRSELFVASEVWRLEQLGVRLRLYVLRQPDEAGAPDVAGRIRTVPSYLPPMSSISGTRIIRWLRANAGPLLPALRYAALHHPVGLARAAAAAGAQSVRARNGWRPRAVYLKELLQAAELARRLEADTDGGAVRQIHAHFAHGATTVAWLASMITGLPFSFTGHAKDIYQPSLNPAGLLARKLRAAVYAITCTEANGEHLRALAPTATVHVVHHGLNADLEALLEAGSKRPSSNLHDPPVIVSVGRLVRKKGFDLLVQAVAELRDEGRDVQLSIIGDEGPDGGAVADELAKIIADRGLGDAVALVPAVDQRTLLHALEGATIMALACRVVDDGDRDGIPNVLVEAMAAGVPVVSTTVSGIPELVHSSRSGILVPPDDPTALAAALASLLDDPQRRTALAAEARRTVAERFDGLTLARTIASLLPEQVR